MHKKSWEKYSPDSISGHNQISVIQNTKKKISTYNVRKKVTGLSTEPVNVLIVNVRASHLQVILPTHIREAIRP